MNATTWFESFFLVLLLVVTLGRLWLSGRQIRHVQTHRSEVPEAFRTRISLEEHQKAADYTCAKARLRMVQTLGDAVLLFVFTEGGLLAHLDQLIRTHVVSWWVHDLLLGGSVLVVGVLVDMPFTLYDTFRLETRFGFNRMTPRLFLADLVRESLITSLLGAPLFLAAVAMMNSLGPFWWVWSWVAWMLFSVGLQAIYPTWIAPLFNRFSPLPTGELREKIESLLKRCGFDASGLFVMDGSRRSRHGNAYFTGFGRSRRVVFFDTLLERLNPEEVEAVLAHELGHYHGRHVLQRILMTFALSLVFLMLLGWLKDAPWFYQGLGVNMPGTAMSLILFTLVMPLLGFPLKPLMSLHSRKHEFEADDYAARHTSANRLVSALVKLYQDNAATLTPDPLHSAIYDSHPPAAVRIAHLESLSSA